MDPRLMPNISSSVSGPVGVELAKWRTRGLQRLGTLQMLRTSACSELLHSGLGSSRSGLELLRNLRPNTCRIERNVM